MGWEGNQNVLAECRKYFYEKNMDWMRWQTRNRFDLQR